MYAGCMADAIQKDTYLGYIEDLGFESFTLQKEKPIIIPDDILAVPAGEEIEEFKNGNTGIYSITVFVQKSTDEEELQLRVPHASPDPVVAKNNKIE